MDLGYFGFHPYPFERNIPTGEPFPFASFQEAIPRLRYSIEKHTISVLFPDEVIDRIYDYSRGAIRLVARLCKGCLMDAYAHKQQLVDNDNLERVVEELAL